MATSGDQSSECLEENVEEQKMEVLSLESMFPDKISILSEPYYEAEDTEAATSQVNVYNLKINISVDLTDFGKITVEASKSSETHSPEDNFANLTCVDETNKKKPHFQRSVSGRRWQAHFVVSHLTPLCLHLVLPRTYPSLSPPQYTLSCLWLGLSQLDILCRELDRVWEENQGMAIIYLWMDWLQNNTLSCLGLENTVYLSPPSQDSVCLQESPETRALPECINVDEGIAKLLRYDYEETQHEFMQTLQTCGVCFDEKLGEHFFRLSDCAHHFCVDCMASYCEIHVKEGTVQQLTCPSPKCTTPLPPEILQAVLGEEEYSRWERLILQNTLDTMGDIVWCPRCNNPVIREQEEHLHLAHCTTCFYSFCTRCMDPWHQGNPCENFEEELDEEALKREQSKEVQKRKKREKRILYKLSKTWIDKFTKSCPKCFSPIEKNGGCNNVTCFKCHTSICWVCSKIIVDYSHFTSCAMWSDTFTSPRTFQPRPVPEGALRVREHLKEHRTARDNVLVNCPRCNQRNLKENRNNHIRCHSCRTNFCFMCRQIIQPPVTSHYKIGSKCVQHSD